MSNKIKINISEKLLQAVYGDKADVFISTELQNELEKIAHQPLDLEEYAKTNEQFKPMKKAISIRMDLDLLEWFQTQPGKYQKLINKACRIYMNMQTEKI